MRYFTLILLAFLLMATLCPTAVGQAAAEYGLGAGRASTTTAPARHIGTSMSDLFGSINKAAGVEGATATGPEAPGPEARPTTVQKARRRTPARQSAKPAETKAAAADAEPATPPSPAPPAPVYEDPQQIRAGIGYDEMVRRFGPPSMSITTGPGASTLRYSTNHGSDYQVDVEDGRVIAVAGARE